MKEVFLTLQGEGANAGRAAVFVRFTGCNLWSGREENRSTAVCQFCDTDFLGTDGLNGGRYTASELVDRMNSVWGDRDVTERFCVLTGGEPTLQLDETLGAALSKNFWHRAIETNGTRLIASGCVDWITVSPKAGAMIVQQTGNELKLVYPQDDFDPAHFEEMDFDHFFLSPKWTPDPVQWRKNTAAVVFYCLEHPKWRCSIQSHKFLEIP